MLPFQKHRDSREARSASHRCALPPQHHATLVSLRLIPPATAALPDKLRQPPQPHCRERFHCTESAMFFVPQVPPSLGPYGNSGNLHCRRPLHALECAEIQYCSRELETKPAARACSNSAGHTHRPLPRTLRTNSNTRPKRMLREWCWGTAFGI